MRVPFVASLGWTAPESIAPRTARGGRVARAYAHGWSGPGGSFARGSCSGGRGSVAAPFCGPELVDVVGKVLDLERQHDAHDADRNSPDSTDGDQRRQRGPGVGEREDA